LLKDAGYGLHGDFHEMPMERTVDMIRLNITTLTERTYLFARDMATRRSGHILLVASRLASRPFPATRPMRRPRAYVLHQVGMGTATLGDGQPTFEPARHGSFHSKLLSCSARLRGETSPEHVIGTTDAERLKPAHCFRSVG
jgi:hypothetical protein